MDPKGKTALITGGARIGQTVAEELAKKGCDIIFVFRSSKKKAEETLQKIKNLGSDGFLIQADLQKIDEIQKIIPEIERQNRSVDILINMASSYEKTPFETLGEKSWTENLETNLQSAYTLSLSASKLMKKQGGGRIINFSDWISASGRPRYKAYLPYYVSKTGVLGLTQGLALELAPDILVNAIAPGPILAPPDITPEEDEEVQKATPLKRWGGSIEIAKTVLFLIETDFVTGECIRVDGGRHLY